jgi:site-specific DNA recombinase
MKKAVILARVSTKRQEEEGLSLQDIQLPVLRRYAKEHGFTVDERDEFVFQESADRKIRKKFDEMIGYVKKNKNISAIITYRVDRITRNFRDAVSLDNLRLEYEKEIHFVNDRLVITQKSTGRDIQDWDLKVFLAKQTINRLKDDERISRKRKLENGELPGPAPFGYKNVTLDNKKKWVKPHELKSLIVKKIYQWYASENYSLLEISRKLRKEYKTNKSRSMVHFILNNRFYIGYITNEGQEYPHKYDQFIDKKIYDKVQAVMNKRSGNKKRFKYAGKEFAYRGLLRCHQCGCMITPELKKRKLANGNYNYHTYYHCTNYHKVHKKVKSVKESTIDKQFADLFDNLEIPEKELKNIVTSLKQSHQDKNYFFEQEFNYLNSQLSRQKKRVSTAYEDRLDGCITRDKYEKIRKGSEEKQKELEKKIADLNEAEREYYMTVSFLVELGSRSSDIFSRSKPHEKRALLNFVLSNRELDGEKVLYKAKFPFNTVLKYAPSSNWLPG